MALAQSRIDRVRARAWRGLDVLKCALCGQPPKMKLFLALGAVCAAVVKGSGLELTLGKKSGLGLVCSDLRAPPPVLDLSS
jgi:hypothetical protein